MKQTHLFFDFEMTGISLAMTPISLGIVADNGSSFYAEFIDYNTAAVDEWLRENVIAKLTLTSHPHLGEQYTIQDKGYIGFEPVKTDENWQTRGTRSYVRSQLLHWLSRFKHQPVPIEETESAIIGHYEPDSLLFVGDTMAADWMLMLELIGKWNYVLSPRSYKVGVPRLPENISIYPLDIASLFIDRGIDPDVNREGYAFEGKILDQLPQKHNALWDAKVIKACHDKLYATQRTPA